MKSNDSEPTSKPLELTAPVWIGLALVALLGVFNRTRHPDRTSTLEIVQPFDPVIVRHQGTSHRFIQMRMQLTLPDGWVYLSVVDDAFSLQATVVHADSNTIVSFRPNLLDEWPPSGHSVREEVYSGANVQWVSLKLPRRIRVVGPTSEALLDPRLAWTDYDPRQLGRIRPRGVLDPGIEDDAPDVIMIVMTHDRADKVNSALQQLCDAVRFPGYDSHNTVGKEVAPVTTITYRASRF